MSNTITVKKCDNELAVIAFNSTDSYLLAIIKSGFQWSSNLNITLDIVEGTYTEPLVINKLDDNNPVTKQITMPTPSGCNLSLVGLNWAEGRTEFEVSVNGTSLTPYSAPNGDAGVVWTPSVIKLN